MKLMTGNKERKDMRRIGMAVLMVVIFTGGAGAQQKVLTFAEAVRIAMQNSVALNTQRNNLEVNQMFKTASYVSMGPNVSLNASAVRIDGNSFNPQTGTVINGIRDNITGSVNANINLFSGFQTINTIKQNNQLTDAQAYNVSRTTQDVINTVAAQYLNVMLDKELLRIAKQNFDALSQQLAQVREQAALGSRSPVDEYNQEAQTKAAELRYVQAEIALNNDRTLLAQTLLIDPFEEFDVELPNWDINQVGGETLDMRELAEKAKIHRGDYLRAVRQEEAQRFGLATSRGRMMPSLVAFGTIGSAYNFQHNVPDSVDDGSGNMIANPAAPRPFSEQFRSDNVYKQYGLQLQIPILNGFQNRSTYYQQKKLYDNAQLNRKNVEYQIQNDVIRTVRNYDGAKKQFGIAVDQLKSADVAFQLETERYNLGITNFVDFVNANRTFVQAEADKARAEYNLVFQKILLEYAVGTLKAEDLQNGN
jgi:outer membrane protein